MSEIINKVTGNASNTDCAFAYEKSQATNDASEIINKMIGKASIQRLS